MHTAVTAIIHLLSFSAQSDAVKDAQQGNDAFRRRSSTRSIKRKKFDDELVESSLHPSQPKIERIIKSRAQGE